MQSTFALLLVPSCFHTIYNVLHMRLPFMSPCTTYFLHLPHSYESRPSTDFSLIHDQSDWWQTPNLDILPPIFLVDRCDNDRIPIFVNKKRPSRMLFACFEYKFSMVFLVKISLSLFSDLVKTMSSSPVSRFPRNQCHLTSMCLVHTLTGWFLIKNIAPMLSSNIIPGSYTSIPHSCINVLSSRTIRQCLNDSELDWILVNKQTEQHASGLCQDCCLSWNMEYRQVGSWWGGDIREHKIYLDKFSLCHNPHICPKGVVT
jgi:hypothetical protein